MKILVVDDDCSVCVYLKNSLEKWDYEVITCHNGMDAWNILQTETINLLLTDWMMPGLSGIELCEKIRTDLRSSHYIYIILLTGKSGREDSINGYQSGADDFISKPIHPGELSVRIKAGERLLQLEDRLLQQNQKLEAANIQIKESYQTIKDSLNAAAKIQQTLLPDSPNTHLPVNLAWEFQPADELAGDLFNFYPLDDTHLAMYIIDVVGHGVPAAMLSVYLNKMLLPVKSNDSLIYDQSAKHLSVTFRSPAKICTLLNQKFQQSSARQNNNEMLYFTMIYAIINTATGAGNLCQAGHPYPLISRKNGAVEVIGQGGHPIGLFEQTHYQNIDFSLQSGDRFILYSDAITECSDSQNQFYGIERLQEILKQSIQQPLQITTKQIVESVEQWHGTGKMNNGLDDDLSLLAVELKDRC
ncbi:MAG: SpoIIE family protein phosphatase [gamma proteobacterium symbiont of Taylorina sp.]|nr:SpoIIE family protein phosphatase [gamma proteobacterium symbiont of Taylorina sp.]